MPSQELTNFITEINQIMKKLICIGIIVGIAMSSCQSDVVDPADIDITAAPSNITSFRPDWSNYGSFTRSRR